MNVIERIESAKGPLFSFEVIPPLKGVGIETLFKAIDPLIDLKPSFINVTYHREEFVYKKREKGYLEKVSMRKRPGTVSICAAIQHRYSIDTVPHLICGGFTKEETEDALFSLYYIGIENILIIKGDEIGKSEYHMEDRINRNVYAIDLVDQVHKMNKGQFLHEETISDFHTNFCVGVAGYPEKHFEAPNFKNDLIWLKKKVDLGAEYIVTQMFFDNKKYFDFVKSCRNIGINVPIIPGLKPLTTKSQLTVLPKIFHIDIPEDLVDAVEACKDNTAVKEVAIEWGIAQAKELIEGGAPCLHYYTMGKPDVTKAIISKVL